MVYSGVDFEAEGQKTKRPGRLAGLVGFNTFDKEQLSII
jgi:hypothetical protein